MPPLRHVNASFVSAGTSRPIKTNCREELVETVLVLQGYNDATPFKSEEMGDPYNNGKIQNCFRAGDTSDHCERAAHFPVTESK